MHPVVFSVPGPWGALPIYAYGVCLALGVLASWYAAKARLGSPDGLGLPFLAVLLGATLGGALGHALLAFVGAVAVEPSLSGRALSGPLALLGGLVGLRLIARRGGQPEGITAALAPGLPLIYGADALGHYLHGSGFGRLLGSSAPSLLRQLGTFPRWELPGGGLGSPAYVHHLLTYPGRFIEGAEGAGASLPVQPVQLYDLLLALLVFALLWWLPRRIPASAALPLGAALLALGHLGLDPLRYLPGGPPAAGLFVTQWLVLLVVFVGLGGLGAAWRRGRLPRALEGAQDDGRGVS